MGNKALSKEWVTLYNSGVSVDEIATRFNKPKSTVYYYLKKKNVEMRKAKNVGGAWEEVPISKAKQLYETGISISEVGRVLGFNKGIIRHALNKNGIKTTKRNNIFTDQEVSDLYLYGFSLEEVANLYGVGRCKIRTALSKVGTKVRKSSSFEMDRKVESVDYAAYEINTNKTKYTNSPSKYSNSNKVFTNEVFFDEWSHELAYFLGWMASDGNVSTQGNAIRVTSTDIEHLESLFSLFSYGWSTSIRKWDKKKYPNHKTAGTISISREDIMNKLISYGIPPKKALILEMPYIPSKYLRDFVRGVFEGDGCISLKDKASGTITFASGSKKFLSGLGKSIRRQTGLKIYLGENSDSSFKLVYSSVSAIKELFKYMYEGVPRVLILKRKYDVFKSLFENRMELGLDEGSKHKGKKKPLRKKDAF